MNRAGEILRELESMTFEERNTMAGVKLFSEAWQLPESPERDQVYQLLCEVNDYHDREELAEIVRRLPGGRQRAARRRGRYQP